MYIKLFEEFIKQNSFLEYVISNLGLKIKNPILLGSGLYGKCYELNNNKVIKFFIEEDSEIYNSIKQRDLKLTNLVKIYEVGKVEGTLKKWFTDYYKNLSKINGDFFKNTKPLDIYFVIMEKLNTKTNLIDYLYKMELKYKSNHHKRKFTFDVLNYIYSSYYNLFEEEYEKIELEEKLENFTNLLDSNELTIYNSIYSIYENCANNEIIITDDNFLNFGLNKNNNIVLFDLMDSAEYNLVDYYYNDDMLNKIIK